MNNPGRNSTEALATYGFDPADRALRSWLWQVLDDGTLEVVGATGSDYADENYLGARRSETPGFDHVSYHQWRPL